MMSDLDEKLREIVREEIKSAVLDGRKHAGMDIDYPVDGRTHFAVQDIKQAFADEGYFKKHVHKTSTKLGIVREVDVKGEEVKLYLDNKQLMTGQEWYDRFEKELGKENLDDIAAHDVGLEREMLDAAKRVAGLEG